MNGSIVLVIAASACACATGCGGSGREEVPCGPDEAEPGDTVATPRKLDPIEDDPIGSNALPQKVSVVGSIHDASDVDHYSVDVKDTGLGGNPKVDVLVSSGFEATVTPRCTSGTVESIRCLRGVDASPSRDATSCRTEQPADAAAAALTQVQVECRGTSSDHVELAIVVARVTSSPTCERYRLTVSAD